jgi:ribosome production factor 1
MAGLKPKNKLRRQASWLNIKKKQESEKRDARLRRKREEDKDPTLRAQRHATNVPHTIESKRVWDEPVGDDEDDALGWAVDVERLAKRRKTEREAAEAEAEAEADEGEEGVLARLKKQEREAGRNKKVRDEDADSMLDAESDLEDDESDLDAKPRATSPTPSVATTAATNLELSPEFLKQKFPA